MKYLYISLIKNELMDGRKNEGRKEERQDGRKEGRKKEIK